MTRKYSSTSVATTLAVGISNTATSMSVSAGTGAALLGGQTLAAGNVDQFTLVIDPDTVNEEVVFATAVSSDTFTIVRGRAGSSAIAHSGSATVKHVLTSDDLNYYNAGVATANAAVPTSTIQAKGDLLVGTGLGALQRLATGTNTYVLTADSTQTTGLKWSAAAVGDVTLTGTQTLTNKTLTAPVISTITNTGTLTLPTSTDTLVGKATTDTLTNKTLTAPVISTIVNTGTLTLPSSTDTLVGRATTDTLTNKTLTTPSVAQPIENAYTTATGFAGYTYYALNGTVQYITANATASGIINFAAAASGTITTMNALLAVGQSISCVLLITNGATAYYPTSFQIDGVAVTPKWSGGTAPSSGNASSIDGYTFTIIKTAASTYTVLAGTTKFA